LLSDFYSKMQRILRALWFYSVISVLFKQSHGVECGIGWRREGILGYTVLIFGVNEGKVYKDCLGTLLETSPNCNSTNLVLTSKTCLDKESISKTLVIPTKIYTPALPNVGIKIRQIITTNESIISCTTYTPVNFALLKLHAPIRLGSRHFAICLPSMRLRLLSHMHCLTPKLLNTASSSYGPPLRVEILRRSYCKSHMRHIRLFFYKFICGHLKVHNYSTGDDIQVRIYMK
ncbi:hypothetical protein T4A_3534, partial [Trichinella pseudospiralis]